MNEKKYLLRNGVVVVPEHSLGFVRVVDTQNAVFSAVAEYTAQEVAEAWAVGDVRLLRCGGTAPLSWDGGAWGEQFDVVAKVPE